MTRPKNDQTELTHLGVWSWRSKLLWSKIRKGPTEADCWTWIGSRSKHANLFGVYKNGQAQMSQAIRIIYREVTGLDCEELSFRHTCGSRFCCNPSHISTHLNNRKYPK